MTDSLDMDNMIKAVDNFLSNPQKDSALEFIQNWNILTDQGQTAPYKQYVEIMGQKRPGNQENVNNEKLSRFGEFFYSNEHTNLFFDSLNEIFGQNKNKKKQLILTEIANFQQALQDIRLEHNSTKRLIDVLNSKFDPIHFNFSQNTLLFLSLLQNDSVLDKASLFNTKEKDKIIKIRSFAKSYTTYWRTQCLNYSILEDMDKFLEQMKNHLVSLQNTDFSEGQQQSIDVGHFVMDFKSRPDIDLVLSNALRAEAYTNSWLVDINLSNLYRETLARAIHESDYSHNDRRKVLLGLISGFDLTGVKDKIQKPYNEDFEASAPDLSLLGFLYPLLNEIPAILLEQSIEKEKTLLAQEIQPMVENQTVDLLARNALKKSHKI